MRRNTVKQRLAKGEAVIGTMVREIFSAASFQVFKAAGFDFVMVDMEHGPYSLKETAELLRFGRVLDLCPMVRAAGLSYEMIARPLDQGAMGVMLPRVETREEVEGLIAHMKYPPEGKRGSCSGGAHSEYVRYPVPEFLRTNNEDTLAIVQIEKARAVERIEDLLSVPHVDGAVVGPEDLSVSMGIPGETTHPRMIEAIEHVIEVADRHGVATGIHVNEVATLREWRSKGMRLIMCSSDISFLIQGASAVVKELRRP